MIPKNFLLIALISLFLFLNLFVFGTPKVLAEDLDITSAQNRIGIRFSSKFCEAKADGQTGDASSEFALNNTFLKFAELPDDDNYMNDLWTFTKIKIIENCGDHLTKKDVVELKQFFIEEAEIARNRDLYLPDIEYSFSPRD